MMVPVRMLRSWETVWRCGEVRVGWGLGLDERVGN
jgi:hypothetical protein